MSALRSLDARAKLVAFLGVVVVSATTPVTSWPALLATCALAALLLWASGAALDLVLRRLLVVAPLVLGLALGLPWLRPEDASRVQLGSGPSVSEEALRLVAVSGGKAILAVVLVSALGAATPLAEALDGLARLGAPRLLVLLVGVTHRYAHVLVDEATRLRRARDARGWRGRWLADAPVTGRLAGALLLRSNARAERVHRGMLARGWDGRAHGPPPRPLVARDVAFAGAVLGLALLARVVASGRVVA